LVEGISFFCTSFGLRQAVQLMYLVAFLSLALGLVDDARVLSPKTKLAGQVLIALLLVALGLRVRFVHEPWLSAMLTVFWVVAISNAINFIDIMDGLAAGVSSIAALGFFIFSVAAGRPNDSIAALALAGAAAGFLVFNFAPAKVYMGDAGSLFLGFTLSAIAINERYTRSNRFSVFIPLLILALPLFALALMSLIRPRKGIAPWRGSPDHIPLRLRALGFSKVKTVLTLYVATALLCLLAYGVHLLKDSHAMLAWGALGVAVLAVLGTGICLGARLGQEGILLGFFWVQLSNACFALGQVLYRRLARRL